MTKQTTCKCDDCGKEGKLKRMYRRNGGFYCYHCSKKQSKCLMPHLSGEIPKSYIPPKRKLRKKVVETKPPIIKGAKKPIIKTRKVHLFLTKQEKYILYKKLVAAGIPEQEASERVNNVAKKMNELAEKIRIESREKQLTEQQMNKKFLEGLHQYSQEAMK